MRAWNEGMINRLFMALKVNAILAIPLNKRRVQDKLTWRLARDGKLSVKNLRLYIDMTLPILLAM